MTFGAPAWRELCPYDPILQECLCSAHDDVSATSTSPTPGVEPVIKINVANRWAVTTSVALLAAGTIVATASPAQAAYWPHRGDLCQAVENIQFYADDFSTPSYVVQTNEYIRIDIDGETLVDWTQGHGDGHSSRNFIYRHSDGQLRLKNCH